MTSPRPLAASRPQGTIRPDRRIIMRIAQYRRRLVRPDGLRSRQAAAALEEARGSTTRFSILGYRRGSTCGLTRAHPRVATMEHMTERDVVTVRGLRKAYGTRVVVHERPRRRGAEINQPGGFKTPGRRRKSGPGSLRPDAAAEVLAITRARQRSAPPLISRLQDSALPDRRAAERCAFRYLDRTGGDGLEQFGLGARRRSGCPRSKAAGSGSGFPRARALLNRPPPGHPRRAAEASARPMPQALSRRPAAATARHHRTLVTHEMRGQALVTGRAAGPHHRPGTRELVDVAATATVQFTLPDLPGPAGELGGWTACGEWSERHAALQGDRRIAHVGASPSARGRSPRSRRHVPDRRTRAHLLEPGCGTTAAARPNELVRQEAMNSAVGRLVRRPAQMRIRSC